MFEQLKEVPQMKKELKNSKQDYQKEKENCENGNKINFELLKKEDNSP